MRRSAASAPASQNVEMVEYITDRLRSKEIEYLLGSYLCMGISNHLKEEDCSVSPPSMRGRTRAT
jgi:hypothetical protein